jgi:hypothetical protein
MMRHGAVDFQDRRTGGVSAPSPFSMMMNGMSECIKKGGMTAKIASIIA